MNTDKLKKEIMSSASYDPIANGYRPLLLEQVAASQRIQKLWHSESADGN